MSSFKNELQKKIITPTKYMIDEGIKTDAIIKESFPQNNYCTIEFVNKDGKKETKYGVPVRRYAKGIIGWFPEIGDEVLIENIGGHYEVIAQSSRNFYSDNKSKRIITKDILSDIMGDGIGGNIF